MQFPIMIDSYGIWVQLRYIYGRQHPDQEDYELRYKWPWVRL